MYEVDKIGEGVTFDVIGVWRLFGIEMSMLLEHHSLTSLRRFFPEDPEHSLISISDCNLHCRLFLLDH